MSTPAPGTDIGPPGRTRLVMVQGTKHEFTTRRTTDSRTAVCKGLAEYLESIIVEAEGGRKHRFKKVFQTWAEPDDESQYPSACVYTMQSAIYDASRFTPGVSSKNQAADGSYVMQYADFSVDLVVDVWCTDPKERQELCFGIELAMNPVTFMYGFILELPHYYNQRAVYEMKGMNYLDTEEDAMRRYRRAIFTVGVQMPVIQLHKFPEAKPFVRLDEVGGHVIVRTVIETS